MRQPLTQLSAATAVLIALCLTPAATAARVSAPSGVTREGVIQGSESTLMPAFARQPSIRAANALSAVIASHESEPGHQGSLRPATVITPADATNYTWTGQGSSDNWSSGSNWSAGIAPSAMVGTLTFPNLSSPCDACYSASNDIPGLAAEGLDVDSDSSYQLSGDGITLGSSGLTVTSPSDADRLQTIALPLTLASPQTWIVAGATAELGDSIDSSDEALTLAFTSGGVIEPASDVEVGDLTAGGSGGLFLGGDTGANDSDGNPVELSDGAGIEADQSENSVGPLTVGSDSWVSVGGLDDGAGQLAVNGPLALDGGSQLDLTVDAPGYTAGLDYSQLAVTGNIDLSGSQLDVSQGADVYGDCDDLQTGQSLTLLTTTGTITGTFENYGPGASVDIENDCDDSTEDATGTLTYTATSVILTITGPGDAGDVPTELDPPTISGTPEEGQYLSLDRGTWEGATSYTYSWWACSADACNEIPGAVSETFVPTTAQAGDQIYAMVVARNQYGSNWDITDETAAVATVPVPVASSAPTINGYTGVGETYDPGEGFLGDYLFAFPGQWTNSPTTYSFQWERCAISTGVCAPISGATGSEYTPTAADLGSCLEVQMITTNAGGTSQPSTSMCTPEILTWAGAPVPTIRQIAAAMQRILEPKAGAATRKAILKRHGYAFTFDAPSQGTLQIIWSMKAGHRNLVPASEDFTPAGKEKLRVVLEINELGVKDLRRDHNLVIDAWMGFKSGTVKQVVMRASFKL